MARIFLCHANEDKAQVREVYYQLKALGFTPWLDEVGILPGQDWDYEIERALETSDFVIVFLSTRSVEKVGYVQREFRRALYHAEEMPEGFIHTIPVKLDNCTVPSRFSRHQWVNLYENGAFNRVVLALRRGLQQRGQPVLQPLIHDPSPTRTETALQPILQPPPRTSRSEAPTTAASALEHTSDWVVEFTVPGETYSARIVVSKLWKTIGGPVIFLTLFHPEQEPTLLLRVEAFSIEVDASDFDADGRPEIAVLWRCGAHSRGFRLYRLKTSGEPELIPGTDLGSDWPLITWNSIDDKGCREIVTRDRDWDRIPTHGYVEKRFGWNGDSYVLLSEQLVRFEPEDA
jgi:hypothetical protein